MISIQAFWFVAFAVADRIATLPAPPICSPIRSIWVCAMPSAVAWLMKTSRQAGSVSESKVTTLAPPERAWSSAEQIALGSFAEVTMTSAPCWVSVLM
jgi:hypothetical protein